MIPAETEEDAKKIFFASIKKRAIIEYVTGKLQEIGYFKELRGS